MKNWSESETNEMLALFWQGLSAGEIAKHIPGRTERAVKGRWERLRLSHERRVAYLGNGDSSLRAVADEAEMQSLIRMTLSGDAAFVRAMLNARRSGEEKITLGIVKAHGTDSISTKVVRAATYMPTASVLAGC